MTGCYGPWKTKWDQSGIKSKIKKRLNRLFKLLAVLDKRHSNWSIMPKPTRQTGREDRCRFKTRSEVTEGHLVHAEAPTASIWPVSSRGSSESWWLFTHSDWKSGINESHQSMDLSVRLGVCCISVCLDPWMACAVSHYLYSSLCSCLFFYLLVNSFFKKLILMNS